MKSPTKRTGTAVITELSESGAAPGQPVGGGELTNSAPRSRPLGRGPTDASPHLDWPLVNRSFRQIVYARRQQDAAPNGAVMIEATGLAVGNVCAVVNGADLGKGG